MSTMGEPDRLRSARDAHARRDWATAYDSLSQLRRLDQLGTDDLSALGDAAWWLGLIRETLEVCEECHDRYLAEGRLDRAAMAALESGFGWYLRGRPEIGAGWINRARRLLADQPAGLGHGLLLWMEVNERASAGDVTGTLEGSRQLQRMATDLDAPVLACFGLVAEGILAIRQGHTDRGFGLLDEAMLPVLAGRIPADWAGNLYCQMMALCHDLADVPRARRWTTAMEQWCDLLSSAVMIVGICRVHRAQLLRLEGAWDAAVHEATTATEELAELNVEAVAEALFELGEIHRLRGDLAAARSAYDASQQLGRDPRAGTALLLLAEGRDADSEAAIRQALAEESDAFRRARLLVARVQIDCGLRDVAGADAAATELQALADTYRSPGFRAWAALARGAASLVAGSAPEALIALRTALTTFQSMGATYDAAVVRSLMSRALASLGESVAAAAERDAADEVFLRLGATQRGTAWVDDRETAGEIAPGGLTPREREIVCAVAEGMSNREVAARLVISEKTVARHLANIFLKLDVSSRTAAAAWAYREGLVSRTDAPS